MPKPERLEDLGRIREKLERLFDKSVALEAGFMHDEYFCNQYSDGEKLEELYRSLKHLRSELTECMHIACGLKD